MIFLSTSDHEILQKSFGHSKQYISSFNWHLGIQEIFLQPRILLEVNRAKQWFPFLFYRKVVNPHKFVVIQSLEQFET